jgi:thioredoxin 1
MPMSHKYETVEPLRADLDQTRGVVVLEFGAPWCGFCKAAQPAIVEALEQHPEIRHIKVEDGRGHPLGRSFHVKLWPTLVALRDGREVARQVRPEGRRAVAAMLATLLAPEEVTK